MTGWILVLSLDFICVPCLGTGGSIFRSRNNRGRGFGLVFYRHGYLLWPFLSLPAGVAYYCAGLTILSTLGFIVSVSNPGLGPFALNQTSSNGTFDGRLESLERWAKKA